VETTQGHACQRPHENTAVGVCHRVTEISVPGVEIAEDDGIVELG
jgi:hypothetical protein